jgi:hypothetical protein
LHRSRKHDLDGFVVFFLFFFFHHTYWSTFYPVSVEVLQDGRGTDVKKQNKSIIDADGFILVSGKNYIPEVTQKVLQQQEEILMMRKIKLFQDHYLETIPLVIN